MSAPHRRHAPLGLVAVLLVTLAGCATRGVRPERDLVQVADPVAFLQSREKFDLAGRVAGAVGSEGFNAQLELQQRGRQSQLALRSPLGFGSATVTTDGRELDYRSSRGESLRGEQGLAALTARLGFEPPLASLRYWLLGVPDPAAPEATGATADGFEQSGWRIRVGERMTSRTAAGTVPVPHRVTLERAPVRLRIVVDRWALDR